MRTVTFLLFLSSILALAQPEPPTTFEVASVKAGQPGRESIEAGPASLTMRNVRLNACIGWAFNIQDAQVIGPSWISQASFDIIAKSAGPATEAQLRSMLQALLVDRFQLAFRRESREIPALILVVSSKGHKLKPAEKPGEPSFRIGNMNLAGEGATVGELTRFLSSTLHETVIDQTGLKGLFNYTLDINSYLTEEMRKSTGTGPPLEANSIIAQAMQEQLGLKVESKKTPVSVVVVEHIEKAPTEN